MATGRPNGRPPKPLEVKIQEGNRGHRQLPKATLQDEKYVESPEPPHHLTSDGVALWSYIWEGGNTWLKPTRDYITVQLFCETWESYHRIRRLLKLGRAGGGVDAVSVTEKGYPVQHPYIAMEKGYKAEINTYISTLGLSPVDFARLQIADISETEKESIQKLLSGGRGERHNASL